MEFRYIAGERDPAFIPLRGGFIGGDMMHQQAPLGAAMRRELQKEMIRKEIIAQEMVERRILEDEVRREMEMERAMGIQRVPLVEQLGLPPLPPPQFAMLPPPIEGMFAEGFLPGPFPGHLEVRGDYNLPLGVSLDGMVIQEMDSVRDGDFGKQPLHVDEVKLSKRKVPGIRKNGHTTFGGRSSQIVETGEESWGCALCQVIATSKEDLETHLQGKKHMSMVEGLAVKDTVIKKKTSGGGSSAAAASASRPKRTTSSLRARGGGRRLTMKVDGVSHQVVERKNFLWCEPCRCKCNSSLMMVQHLGGKRHQLRMEELKEGGKS